MTTMPGTRALLAVDVIGSARNPGYHRDRLWGELTAMLRSGFDAVGLTPAEVVGCEPTGDGALYTLPDHRLGVLVDLAQRLDELAANRNRWSKPDIRLRVAVEIGAVGDGPAYYSPKIDLNRLLGAAAFKELVNRCVTENTDELGNCPINSSLIVSGPAFRSVFGGDYTTLVRETEFVRLAAVHKEFNEQAWVRVPGVDARTLARFAEEITSSEPAEDVEAAAGMPMRVTNTVNGSMTDSVQAGVVTGGVHIGRGRR
jgi:hypothetical protein